MGTIETRIDLENDVTIQTVSGEISAIEIRRAIVAYYESEVTRFILWDFTNARLENATAAAVHGLVELTNTYTDRRSGGKTALVFTSTYSFGMGRMYDLSKQVDDQLIEHASFRDLKAALEWLGVPTGET